MTERNRCLVQGTPAERGHRTVTAARTADQAEGHKLTWDLREAKPKHRVPCTPCRATEINWRHAQDLRHREHRMSQQIWGVRAATERVRSEERCVRFK